VVPASNDDAATPVRPPRAEVPGTDEESLDPGAAAADADPGADTGADELPAPAADGLSEEPQDTKPAAKLPPAGDPRPSAQPMPDVEAAGLNDARSDEPESEAAATARPGGGMGEERDAVASRTAWRTFTAAPPRLAARP